MCRIGHPNPLQRLRLHAAMFILKTAGEATYDRGLPANLRLRSAAAFPAQEGWRLLVFRWLYVRFQTSLVQLLLV